MSLQSTMMKAAALYALKRATENVSEDDVKRWARQAIDRTPAEWRDNAMSTLDTGLMRAGLMRAANAPNQTSLVMTGMIAGIVVGAGAALLLAPSTGADMRKKLSGIFGSSETEEETSTTAGAPTTSEASAGGNGGSAARTY
jgi:hypothetical protein